MRIVQVCPYDYSRPGGVKSHIDNLAMRLRARGHEVTIVAPNINKDKIQSENTRLFGRNRSLHFWGGTQIDVNIALGDEKRELKEFLRTNPIDIVHYHTIWNPFLALQVRYYSRAKNVATFHDTPADSFMGKSVAGGVLMPFAAALLSKYLDGIISVSKSQSSYINPFIKDRIKIIPNGINLDAFSSDYPKLPQFDDGKFNILFLGRLEPRKGISYALEAYAVLKKKYTDVRLIIAGDGEERSTAERYVSAHNLDDVEFMGFIDEDIKPNLFTSADVYLAPAIYGESFGIVLLEAMASGTPIAGFGNEGYLNVVNGPWRDYFPAPKDTEALVGAIERIYQDSTTKESMVKWGLEEVKKYSWDTVTDQIESVYSDVLNQV